MPKKRSAQLDQEIREALAKIPKKSTIKTPAQLDAEIDEILNGGLQAERYEIANALGFRYPKRPPPKTTHVTDTNLFALASLVVEHGGRATFPNRLAQVDYPHIKRCMAGGLVEASSPTTLTLTAEGKKEVLRTVRDDYKRLRAMFDKYGETEPSRFTKRDRDRLDQLQTAIKNLE